jgi:hypothetical protein
MVTESCDVLLGHSGKEGARGEHLSHCWEHAH